MIRGLVSAARRLAALALAAAVLGVSACSAIPSSGPVRTEAISPVAEPADVLQYAQNPIPGGTPQQIVDGFVQAMGVGADEPSAFGTANKFFTASAAASWQPHEVLIYEQGTSPVLDAVSETEVRVTIRVVAALDADGRYSASTPRGNVLDFSLVKDGGEWRISRAPNSVVVSEQGFERSYQLAPLYFPDLSGRSLVYEARYFARPGAVRSVVRELLQGPSAWLADAVRNPVPQGSSVISVTGPPSSSVARINLSPAVQAAPPEDRKLIELQIETSLRHIGVTQVELLVNNQPFTVESPLPNLAINTPAQDQLFFVRQGQLLQTESTPDAAKPVAGVAHLEPGGISKPAISHDLKRVVALQGGTSLVSLLPNDGGKPRVLLTGKNLLAPHFDVLGWCWSAESGGSGLIALDGQGQASALRIDWLAGRQIVALAPSRDGVRIALAIRDSSGFSLQVAAIARAQDGRPSGIGKPLTVGALAQVADFAWADESALAVVGADGGETMRVMTVGVGSQASELTGLSGSPVAIAAGRFKAPTIVVATSDGHLHARLDTRWEQMGDDAASPTFSG